MKIVYECEYCGKQSFSQSKCAEHEKSHLTEPKRTLYDIVYNGNDPCDYCDYSYYAYGCGRDCSQKCRNHSMFKPVEPLHDKRSRGGV